MPETPLTPLDGLCNRYVAELFAFNPGEARSNGDHSYDGVMGPVGRDATRRRISQLEETAAALDGVTAQGVEQRADAISLRHRVALARFQLVELDAGARNPLAMLFRGADPQPYCSHDHAPVPERAAGLDRQLAQLPDWLDAAAGELGDAVDDGPRRVALGVAAGLARFFSEDLEQALPLPAHPDLRERLRSHGAAAAEACTRFATAIAARDAHPGGALGEERLLAMLHAQEGVTESLAALRSAADGELQSLRAQFDEVAQSVAPGRGRSDALARMEQDHPAAGTLIAEAEGSLERVRDFWVERDVVTIPEQRCQVVPSPPFLRYVTAAFDPAGALAEPDVASNYMVTPVDETMTSQQADEWLRSFNRWLLEDVGVHEVYPGHFVHFMHARRQRSLVRRVGFVSGFGEGWAHYTEHLAIEQGLAEGRPLLHLAQLQDAILRACRFRASLMLHAEGGSVDDATHLFMDMTGLPEYPCRREAERGTFDPMYLAYTYGKRAILEWRAELERRPGFTLRHFHDTMLGSGFPPLAAVRELLFGAG